MIDVERGIDTDIYDRWCAAGPPIRDATHPMFGRDTLSWNAEEEHGIGAVNEAWWEQPNQGGDSAERLAMRTLRDRLLAFGGNSAPLHHPEPDLEKILERGQLWLGKNVLMKRGWPVHCHHNAASFWAEHCDTDWKGGEVVLATGYALSDDGEWRQHSWCLCRRPRSVRVIESTEKRLAYFGFALLEDEAWDFYRQNSQYHFHEDDDE